MTCFILMVDDLVKDPELEKVMDVLKKRAMHPSFMQSIEYTSAILQLNSLSLDIDNHIVTVEDEQVHFTVIEYELLHLFMIHPNQLLTYDKIYCRIWKDDIVYNIQNVLSHHVSNINAKIKASNVRIKNHRGTGYVLQY